MDRVTSTNCSNECAVVSCNVYLLSPKTEKGYSLLLNKALWLCSSILQRDGWCIWKAHILHHVSFFKPMRYVSKHSWYTQNVHANVKKNKNRLYCTLVQISKGSQIKESFPTRPLFDLYFPSHASLCPLPEGTLTQSSQNDLFLLLPVKQRFLSSLRAHPHLSPSREQKGLNE